VGIESRLPAMLLYNDLLTMLSRHSLSRQRSPGETGFVLGNVSRANINRLIGISTRLSRIKNLRLEGHGSSGNVMDLEVEYHPMVQSLIEALHESNLIQPFDWPSWQKKAEEYYRGSKSIESVEFETCIKLLTTHVRKDRFCSGHFGAMVKAGHIQRILKRLATLCEESRNCGICKPRRGVNKRAARTR